MYGSDEAGEAMRSVLSLVLAVIVLVVIVLDGVAMFVAYQSSQEISEGAAQQAAIQYVATGGDTVSAEQQAAAFVSQKGGELLSVSFHSADSRWVEAAVRKEAGTYVFHYVPGLNRFLDQDSVAVVIF